MPLVRLDQVFHLAARAVDFLVERLRRTFQVGDDKPAVGPLGRSLDAGDDGTLDLPGLGGIREGRETADFVIAAVEARQRGVVGQIGDAGAQHRVGGQAEDVGDAVALQPVHGLMAGVVAVAAYHDVDARPAGPDGAHHMAQHQRHLGAARGLAWTQDHGDRFAGGGFVNVDRLKAAAVVIGVEQRQLLAAMDPILGVVDIQHDAPWHGLEAIAKQLDHRRHHADQRGPAGQVLQPADGRLRAQRTAAFGQPTDRHLEGRVDAQGLAVIGIRIAASDHQHPKTDHLGQRVLDTPAITRVRQAPGQALGNAKPAFDPGQQQDSRIRGQPTAVESSLNRLAADR